MTKRHVVSKRPGQGVLGRDKRPVCAPAAVLLWTSITALAVLMAFGCGGSTANLIINAPSSTVTGAAITVTVSAKVNGSPDTIFNSPIHFTSSDKAAVLPPDYVFTPADAGSHTFTNGVTFMSVGAQTLTATDTQTSFITVTANVSVSTSASMTDSK